MFPFWAKPFVRRIPHLGDLPNRFSYRYNDYVKVSKAQVSENRRVLVSAAGKLFRQHGINGVGVADIGKSVVG